MSLPDDFVRESPPRMLSKVSESFVLTSIQLTLIEHSGNEECIAFVGVGAGRRLLAVFSRETLGQFGVGFLASADALN